MTDRSFRVLFRPGNYNRRYLMVLSKFRPLRGSEGFTLIELMVVVAIIGVLAAVALPQFGTYRAKARSSEAKLSLASASTGQAAHFMEHSSYGGCLLQMGVSGSAPGSYYTFGFAAATTQPATSGCAGSPTTVSGAGKSHFVAKLPAVIATAAQLPTTTEVTVSTYIIGASGNVKLAGAESSKSTPLDADVDKWTINNLKKIVHAQAAF